MLISEGLQYHLDNNLSLCDSIYREGSQGFLDLICEARKLYNAGHISLFEEDLDLINSDLGTWGIYEGRRVMLDYPLDEEADIMLRESLDDSAKRQVRERNKEKLLVLLCSEDIEIFPYDPIRFIFYPKRITLYRILFKRRSLISRTCRQKQSGLFRI